MTTENINRIIDIAAAKSNVLTIVQNFQIDQGDLLDAMQFALGRSRSDYYDQTQELEFDIDYKQCLLALRDAAAERELYFYTREETLALAAYVDAQINRHAEYHAWLDGN